MSITVYGKPGCQQCTATTRKLDQLGLAYSYVDVAVDVDAACRLQAEGHRTLPVIVAKGETWTGYQPGLLQLLGRPQ